MVTGVYTCPICKKANSMGILDEKSASLVTTYCANMDSGQVLRLAVDQVPTSIVLTPYVAPVQTPPAN